MIHLIVAASVVLPSISVRILLKHGKHLPDTLLVLAFFISGSLNILPLVVEMSLGWVPLIYQGTNDVLAVGVLLLPMILSGVLYQSSMYRLVAETNPAWSFSEYIWSRAKSGFLASMPLVLTLLALATVTNVLPDPDLGLTAITALAGATLSVAFAVYPFAFRAIMKGRRMVDPGLRTVLTNLAWQAKVPISDIIVVPSGKAKTVNAWVAGILPQHRMVFLTEALLANLSLDEIGAVFAHELGHVKGRHLLAYTAYAITATAFFAGTSALLTPYLPVNPGLVPVRGAIIGLLTLLGFSFLSRRFELQADRFSVELTGDVEATVTALEKLGASRPGSLTETEQLFTRIFRTHPSIPVRVRSLRSCRW